MLVFITYVLIKYKNNIFFGKNVTYICYVFKVDIQSKLHFLPKKLRNFVVNLNYFNPTQAEFFDPVHSIY